ncbi:hypothetical protein HG536_0H03360 [Torulaspora globosa]|uniref:Ribosome biogenesis protein NSA1 n=1 Tax=Torulaspora globosa TaxID=48254 RepID=A0A7G3ZN75_9SACH|nr:uncharacterized protein HG536_0H03360 [Torulaspora globosa]QLL34961.1 hypothetical protein HG536_0H03360 [Torulaspora globosa]
MRLIAGCSDNGSLKEVICDAGTDTSKKTALQPLSVKSSLLQGLKCSIDRICVISSRRMILGRNNGVLELVSIERTKHIDGEQENAEHGSKEGTTGAFEISKFEVIDSIAGMLDNSRLAPFYEKSKKRVRLSDGFVSICPLPGSNNEYFVATRSGLISIIQLGDNLKKLTKIGTLEVKAPLDFAQLCDTEPNEAGDYVFGYGGEENLVKLVRMKRDGSSLSQFWEAKNVKNDRLDLRVPVWPIGLKFLSAYSPSDADPSKPDYQFVVVTHWSHLAHYRTQHGRKPLAYKDLLPNREPLTALELIGEDITELGNLKVADFANFSFVTADLKHNVYKFDIDGKPIMKFGKSDITGASSFLGIYKQKYLLQGGLDRYIRIFDLATGSRLVKVYTGSKINSLVMLDSEEIGQIDDSGPKLAKRKSVVQDEETLIAQDDELWERLENNGGSVKKVKKARR